MDVLVGPLMDDIIFVSRGPLVIFTFVILRSTDLLLTRFFIITLLTTQWKFVKSIHQMMGVIHFQYSLEEGRCLLTDTTSLVSHLGFLDTIVSFINRLTLLISEIFFTIWQNVFYSVNHVPKFSIEG